MNSVASLPPELGLERLQRAHQLSAGTALRTPLLSASSLGRAHGGALLFKAESLQRTGSFKLRGALNKLRQLGEVEGVVCGSAGNHGQAVAYAARILGIRCEVFMPRDAPVGKCEAVRAFGAEVHLRGEEVEECIALARRRAAEERLEFVHPFDDLDVIAGQAGVAIELAEEAPRLAAVVVPIGGGGLVSGVGAALRQLRPEVRVIGVRAERGAGGTRETLADGIAVKHAGPITRPLIAELVDETVVVAEAEIAAAMALLLERSKLVVEGAGAVALAAVTSGQVELGEAPTALILSGGNVDAGRLATVAARREAQEGRRLRLTTRVTDRPGGLATLLATVAAANANLLSVDHTRETSGLEPGETEIDLVLETRGSEHAEALRAALTSAGYEAVER